MRRRGCRRDRKFLPTPIFAPIVHLLISNPFVGISRPGGIHLFNGSGRIDVNNTFEERLKLLETDALPSMRATLFGENENRKFKD